MPSGSSHHRHSGSSFDSGGSSATESSGGYCSGSGASLKSSSTCSDGGSSETHTSSTLWSSCSGDPSGGSSVNRSHGQLVESTDNGTLLPRNPRNIFRPTQFLSYSLPLTLNIHIVQSSREGVPATGKQPNNSQLTQSVARNTTVYCLQPMLANSEC
jgi:hypothetical protein